MMVIHWNFLQNSKFKTRELVQSITVVIVLQATELLTEVHFTCQCNSWSTVFVWLYFAMPAVGFSTFVWSLQQRKIFRTKSCGEDCTCIKCCTAGQMCKCILSCWKMLYPGLCWIVILLIDGKYAACALYRGCQEDSSAELTVKDLAYNILISKTIGFVVLAAIVLSYLIYLLLGSCCQSHEGRYEKIYRAQLKKDREKLAMQYIKKCSEKRAARYEREVEEETKDILAGGRFKMSASGAPDQRRQNPSRRKARGLFTPQRRASPTLRRASQGKPDSKPSFWVGE
ncbi:hypothetical protein COCON_G00125960 [Conger conger]|uniref:Uncharacterized protein n=1 Tax=Conger conger TaxID=82655 RepID=A0A9Q1DD03_CONCO|nr:hypothetical protein COCON_G00125960 [Conger conger]